MRLTDNKTLVYLLHHCMFFCCSLTQSLKTMSQWRTTHWLLQYSSSHSRFLTDGFSHPLRMHLRRTGWPGSGLSLATGPPADRPSYCSFSRLYLSLSASFIILQQQHSSATPIYTIARRSYITPPKNKYLATKTPNSPFLTHLYFSF